MLLQSVLSMAPATQAGQAPVCNNNNNDDDDDADNNTCMSDGSFTDLYHAVMWSGCDRW